MDLLRVLCVLCGESGYDELETAIRYDSQKLLASVKGRVGIRWHGPFEGRKHVVSYETSLIRMRRNANAPA
jgi:hypothetical protein